jgi:hypothetical protein
VANMAQSPRSACVTGVAAAAAAVPALTAAVGAHHYTGHVCERLEVIKRGHLGMMTHCTCGRDCADTQTAVSCRTRHWCHTPDTHLACVLHVLP